MAQGLELVHRLAQVIADKKGFNILALDVRGVCAMTDFFIIAEGNVDKHVLTLAHVVLRELNEQGFTGVRVEGAEAGDWVVVDGWEVVIHLFTPDFRQRYRLERIWEAGRIVELKVDWGTP